MQLNNHRAVSRRADVLGQCRMVDNERTRLGGIEKHRVGDEVVEVGRKNHAERRIMLSTKLSNHGIAKARQCCLANPFDLRLAHHGIAKALLNHCPIRCRWITSIEAIDMVLGPLDRVFTGGRHFRYPVIANKLARGRYPG